MQQIKLPREQRLQIVAKLQQYFEDEFSYDLGQLEGDMFLTFVVKEIAPYIYNTAVEDARRVVEQTLLYAQDELYALEQPLPLAGRDARSENK